LKRREGPQLAFDFGGDAEPPAPGTQPQEREPGRKPRTRARAGAQGPGKAELPFAPPLPALEAPVPAPPADPAGVPETPKVSASAPETLEVSASVPETLEASVPEAPEVSSSRFESPTEAPLVLEPVEVGASVLEPVEIGASALEPVEVGASAHGPVEIGASVPAALETSASRSGSPALASRLELLEVAAPGREPVERAAPRFESPVEHGARHETPVLEPPDLDAAYAEDTFDATDVLARDIPFELLEAREAEPPFELPAEDDPYETIEDAPRSGPAPAPLADIVFVVPTGRHVERFVLAGYEATTFPQLEERLLSRLTELSVASRAEERAFVAAVLEEFENVSEIDGMEVRSASFCEALLGALDDLAQAVGSFARARRATVDVGSRRVALLAELEARLDRALAEAGLVARRRVAETLAARVALSAPPVVEEALGARALETRLLVDLSPSHLALVRALEQVLAPRGGRATVCLPMHDRPFDSERIPDPLERVSTWALAHLEDAPRTVPLEPRLGMLDASPASDAPPLSGVEIRLAASREAEAHAVVSAVAAALAGGARIEAVAVGVLRLDEGLSVALGRAFEAAGIAAHGVSHERSMLPAFLADALAALDKTDARTLSRLLSSPYVDLGLPPKEARTHLAALVRRLGSVPNVVAATARAAARVAVARAARPSARREERERDLDLVDRALGAFETFPLAGTASELAAATLAWLVALGVPTRASRADLSLFATDTPDTIAALEAGALARDARAWEAFETALAEVEHGAIRAGRGEVPVPRGRFFDEVFAVYRPSPPLPGASRSFAVRVAELSELADEDLDLLVVPAATTAGLGAAPPRSALLSRETLVALGYDPLVATAKGLAELALASVRAARVVLTACEGDDDDASPVSPIVTALRERGAPVVTFGRGSRLAVALSPADATLVRLLAGELPRDADARARVEIEREREGFFLSERRPMSAVVGALTSDAALAVLGEESGRARPLALTGLERLAECAFRGYAHILLGAREPMEEAELPTARDEGTRLHGALFAALTAVRGLLVGRPRDVERIVQEAEMAAGAYLAAVETGGPLEPLLDRRVRAVVRSVARDAATDERFTFEVGEQAFGEEGPASWPALELGDGDDTVRLRGRIDRVDVGALRASARVIDYKRGRLDELARKLGTTALQVPLYALAAKRPLEVDEVKGIYYSLRDDELLRPNEKARGEEIVDGLLADRTVEKTVLAVIGRLRAGDVAPRPPNETLCRTCGLAGGCRRPRFAMPAEEDEGGGASGGGGG